MSLTDDYAALVCDLDGVVYRGHLAVPHAVDALRACAIPVLYATNNASRTPADVAAHLRDLGLSGVGDAQVVTSAWPGPVTLPSTCPRAHGCLPSEAKASSRHFVGGAGRRVGARGTRPERTVLPSSPAGLRRRRHRRRPGGGARVQAGALWVATNTDGTLPTDRGTSPGNGTLVAAVARATGQEPVVVGKPHAAVPAVCRGGLRRPGVDPCRGGPARHRHRGGGRGGDGPSSSSPAWTRRRLSQQRRPACVPPTCSDLRGLHAAYASVSCSDGWWECAGHRRRVVDGGGRSGGRTPRPSRCCVLQLPRCTPGSTTVPSTSRRPPAGVGSRVPAVAWPSMCGIMSPTKEESWRSKPCAATCWPQVWAR